MNDLLNQLISQSDSEIAPQAKRRKQLNYVLLDGSGSMMSKWYECLDAIDSYAMGVKAAGVDTRIRMATFSGGSVCEYNRVRDIEAQDWTTLAQEPPHCPGGGTPLFNAINLMVREAQEENPDKAHLIIATDGEENGSQTTTESQARELLDWCRARGWQVSFIGADFNNSRLAKLLGAGSNTAIGAPTKLLSNITAELAKKRGYYDKFATPMNWSEAEKKQFGGYLSDQSNGK